MKKVTPVLLLLLVVAGLFCFAAVWQLGAWGIKLVLLLKYFNWHQAFEGVKRFFRYDTEYAVGFAVAVVVSYIVGYWRGASRKLSKALDEVDRKWDAEDTVLPGGPK